MLTLRRKALQPACSPSARPYIYVWTVAGCLHGLLVDVFSRRIVGQRTAVLRCPQGDGGHGNLGVGGHEN